MQSIHFMNGDLVSEEELLVSPRDLGYARGYAVFDFLVTYRHRPFLLDKHIQRLYCSAESIGLTLPWSKEQVAEWVMQTLEANRSIKEEKVIRISVSGGCSLTLIPPKKPTLIITVDPMVYCPTEHYKNGVEIRTVEFQRYQPQAKTNNYIEAVRIFQSIDSKDIDEIVYFSDGFVREGSRSNIFALIDDKLLTPKTGVLEGMTRNVLIEVLDLPVPVEVADFSVDSLRSADEIFITATGKEVMPVTRIDGAPVGEGVVGSVTKEVMRQHADYVCSDVW